MKRFLLVAALFIFGIILLSQDLQYDAIAINIEVPVRVFKGDRFVDNLTIDDFEVYEEGKLQKIEAVYLISKTGIVREDSEIQKEFARKRFGPELHRQFVLIFELKKIFPKSNPLSGISWKKLSCWAISLKS